MHNMAARMRRIFYDANCAGYSIQAYKKHIETKEAHRDGKAGQKARHETWHDLRYILYLTTYM